MTRLVMVCALVACGSPGAQGVAELAEATGSVEASEHASPQAWRATQVGVRFVNGDGVRTGSDATARVNVLRGGGTLRMGPASEIRFGVEGQAARIGLRTGSAVIETGDGDVIVDTVDGAARLRRGTTASIRHTSAGTEVNVQVGLAMIDRIGEPVVEVGAGASVVVADNAIVAPSEAEDEPQPPEVPPAPEPPASVDAGPGDAVAPRAPAAALQLGKRRVDITTSPARVDVRVEAARAVLHDPAPPAAVSVPVESCSGDAVVEVKRGTRRSYYRGLRVVTIEVGAGNNGYRVYCVEGNRLTATDRQGTLRLVKDSGRRRVQTRAPRNEIDADGRNYRLLYQNRRPVITFRWPNAPKSTQYTLVVTSRGSAARRFAADKPTRTLASGAIVDGRHRWWFEAADGARSKETALTVDFDNAAPVAQLSPPKWTDDGVEIHGLAAIGSRVWIGDAEVELDGDHRFSTRVPRNAADARGVTVRVLPAGGDLHYYILRAPRSK